MKRMNSSIVFLACVALLTVSSPSVLLGQSDKWQETLVNPHTVLSVNFNVARMYDGLTGSEKLTKLESVIKKRYGIVLSEVDQFREILSNTPELGLGADETHNTQLTFRKAKQFDAKSVGKMSGYRLVEEKLGKRVAYQAKNDNRGAWGAIAVDDRTLLFAVRRKMSSILKSQELKPAAIHVLSELRKSDIDVCVTFSGGEKSKALFEKAWRTTEYSELFDLYKSGRVLVDSKSKTPLSAIIMARDEETAEKLKAKLQEVAAKGLAFSRDLKEQFDRNFPKTDVGDDDGVREPYAIVADLIPVLETLNFSVDGAKVKVTSSEVVLQDAPKIMASLLFHLFNN